MRSIQVVADVGQIVRLELAKDIEAIVTAITIREEGIAYELTWLAAGEVQSAWLPASAIHKDRTPTKIGFARAE